MPFRDMTISYDNVCYLLRLQIIGKSVNFLERTDVRIVVEQLTDSLGVGHTEAFEELNIKNGDSVCLDWFREHFSSVTNANSNEKILCAARAYFIYLLECTLFGTRAVRGSRLIILSFYMISKTFIHLFGVHEL